MLTSSFFFRNTDQNNNHPMDAAGNYAKSMHNISSKSGKRDSSGSTNMLGNSYAALGKRHGCPKIVITFAMPIHPNPSIVLSST